MFSRRKYRNRRHWRGHVLDVKLSSSQRREHRTRRLAWLLVGSAIFFGTVYGGWRGIGALIERWVYNNDSFAITRLEIETDGVLAAEQLRSWAGVRPRANLMRLDLARVKRDLEMAPAIESVAVERALPGTLRIHVTEREPIAQVSLVRQDGTPAGRYTLDANGHFMLPIEPTQRATPPAQTNDTLPELLGLQPQDVRPGRTTEVPQVHAALALVRAFNHSPMLGIVDLKHIDVRQAGVLVLTTRQGNEVTFGLRDFEPQLRRWRTVHEHASRFGRHVTALDLAVGNNCPMQWLDAAGVSPAPPRPLKPSVYRKKHV
jgi:cell division septal protein FtsQ